MANDSLKTPVIVQATRIDSTILPALFSTPYRLYVIQNGTDFGNVAGKANEAGMGAYDAQVKNDEQDEVLENHESRIAEAEARIENHEVRITAAEATLVDHEVRITSAEATLVLHGERLDVLEADVTDLTDRVDVIEEDYVSKSEPLEQSLSSPLNAFTSYSIDGVKVVGERVTGFTAASGTAYPGTFNADQSFPLGTVYDQTEVQALASALRESRQRIKSLEYALRTHGLID